MFSDIRAVLFDLDGTIYYGNKIIDGADEAIRHCRDLGKKVFFLTNNSTKTRKQILDKLIKMGIPCRYEEVVTSGYVSALYMQQHNLKNVYVCGTDNLREELLLVGVDVCDADTAENMLIGYDPEFDYEKCTRGVRVALQAKQIIACNKERTFAGEGALPFPGCGAMVAPIEWCANCSVDYLVGKPNTVLLETLCANYNYTAKDILVVGDTYTSDTLMANRFGCRSVLISNTEYEDTVCIGKIGEMVSLVK